MGSAPRLLRHRLSNLHVGFALAVAVGGAADLHAQFDSTSPTAATYYASRSEFSVELDRPLLDQDSPYVVVHLRQNRVYLFDGSKSIWSAPAGTGNGFQLSSEEWDWDFSTPRGLFHIKRMERDPLWKAPDWHFVENGRPVPPKDSPVRIMAGVMGNTAIYLGDGIAIHGTGRPELIMNADPEARRVSHGCIRLTNESARSLMHLVEVGTPVLIF